MGVLLHDRIIGALELCCRRGEMLMIRNKRVNWDTCQIGILEVTEDASELAESFIEQHALPAKAAVDALHIAVAVVMGMDYVLTWNCTHIAGDYDVKKIVRALKRAEASSGRKLVRLSPRRSGKRPARRKTG